MSKGAVEFTARDECGGLHVIKAYPCHDVKPAFGGGMSVVFTGEYHRVTTDGLLVERLGYARYRIEQTGAVLISDDPHAV